MSPFVISNETEVVGEYGECMLWSWRSSNFPSWGRAVSCGIRCHAQRQGHKAELACTTRQNSKQYGVHAHKSSQSRFELQLTSGIMLIHERYQQSKLRRVSKRASLPRVCRRWMTLNLSRGRVMQQTDAPLFRSRLLSCLP